MSDKMITKRAGSGVVTYPEKSAHRCNPPNPDKYTSEAKFTCSCGKAFRIHYSARPGEGASWVSW